MQQEQNFLTAKNNDREMPVVDPASSEFLDAQLREAEKRSSSRETHLNHEGADKAAQEVFQRVKQENQNKIEIETHMEAGLPLPAQPLVDEKKKIEAINRMIDLNNTDPNEMVAWMQKNLD